MSLVVFLRFVVKFCVDVLAWPIFGLVYPLCASIWAIETNSEADTQKLNTYWVVFSLILLLEHSLNLLQWFWYWHYIRLIIVCSLVVPHFDGAFYVYKQVICPCLSIDPRIIIDWFAKPKESSTEKEKILAEVEKYVRHNGTEALEKLISSKSGNSKNVEVKKIKAVSSSENSVVINQPNSGPNVASKDVNAVEVIEKSEVTSTNKLSRVESKLAETESRASSSGETKKIVCEVTAGKELPQISAFKAVQKEWTCSICCVTTQSEADFISHLQDKKHKAVDELGKASKKQTLLPKITPLYGTPKKSEELGNRMENPTVPPKVVFSYKIATTSDHGSTDYNVSAKGWGNTQEPTVMAHEKFSGNAKNTPTASSAQKSNERKEKPKRSPSNSEVDIKQEVKVQKEQIKRQNKETVIGNKNLSLWCRVCNIKCTGMDNMNSHLRGRKHLSKMQSSAAK